MQDLLDRDRLASHDRTGDLGALHVADIAVHLDALSPAEAALAVSRLPLERAAAVLDHPSLADPTGLLAALEPAVAAAILDAMAADRLADLFRDMEEPPRERLLALLTPEARAIVAALLVHPVHSAGALMTTEFVSVPASWSVAETLRHIREVESERETIYAIYVLDPVSHRLQRSVSLRRLISGDPEAPVGSVARFERPVTVLPQVDREEVARLISKYDLLAIPVVDEKNHLLGIVTVDDIIDAMSEETTEDVH